MADNRQAVGEQYLQVLGRQARPEELDYLSRFIDQGELSALEVGQFLQSLPEFQQTRLDQDTKRYSDLLAGSDRQILDQAGAAINSRFASLGRPVSSAQGGALAQVGQNLAMQRQSALANFYGQGLQRNSMNQFGMGQESLGRAYALQGEKRNQAWEREMFNISLDAQRDAENRSTKDYLGKYAMQVGLGLAGAGGKALAFKAGGGGAAAGGGAGGSGGGMF